ncbi:MAG: hypothetical protein EPO07_10690, partial [Verrucomicrobia bacterium]
MNSNAPSKFSVPIFSAPASLAVALTASPQNQPAHSWRPSEEHFHGGGLAARLCSEGRRTEDAQQSRKKKNMKTTNQNTKSGAREQIRTVEQNNTNTAEAQSAVAPAPEQTAKKDNRLPIDSAARKANRTLPTPKVLNLLHTQLP